MGIIWTSKAQQQGKAKDIQVTSGWLTEVIVLVYDFERHIFFVDMIPHLSLSMFIK